MSKDEKNEKKEEKEEKEVPGSFKVVDMEDSEWFDIHQWNEALQEMVGKYIKRRDHRRKRQLAKIARKAAEAKDKLLTPAAVIALSHNSESQDDQRGEIQEKEQGPSLHPIMFSNDPTAAGVGDARALEL